MRLKLLFIALSFIILIKLSSFIADVLSEDTIIKWYKEAHSVKGKSVFLEQMSKFIEWLQSAEEGKKILLPKRVPNRSESTFVFLINY